MSNGTRTMAATILATLFLAGDWAWSQVMVTGYESASVEGGAISGQGEVSLRPLPTALRLQLKLAAKGASLEEAIARFKARQKAATDRLEKFGADKKSIHHGPMSIAQRDSTQRRQLQQMIRQRVRGTAPTTDMPKSRKTVSAMLGAEFPLTPKDADEAFLAAYRLEEQVRAAKLAISEEDEKLARDEGEPDEESDYSPFGESHRDPNKPMVAYLVRISKEAQAKAMIESFQNAKVAAAACARAAQVELGPVVTVHSNCQLIQDRSGYHDDYRYRMEQFFPEMEDEDEPRDVSTEALAAAPGQTEFQISTTAVYRIPGSGLSHGAIAGNGSVVLKSPPTLVRMYLLLKGKGRNAEQALASLQKRRAAAIASVTALGADPKAIDPGTPSISGEDAQRQRQLEQMLRSRLRSGGKGRKLKLPETVTVASMFTAQWPLAARPAEELFVIVQKLQSQVKAARLGTGKEAEQQSEEEKELAEEMGDELEQMMSFGNEQQDPNMPYFVYVAHTTPDQRARALAEACQKARAEAERLAQVAGVRLGALVTVVAGTTRSGAPYAYNGPSENHLPRAMQQFLYQHQAQMRRQNDEDETISPAPDGIATAFTATTTFAQAKDSGPAPDAAPASRARDVVSGTGTAAIQKFPTAMRMTMAMLGKGKNLDEALADLHHRRDAAWAQLERLGAKKESFRMSVPSVSTADEQRRRRLQRTTVYSGRGPSPKAAKAPETVTLVASLTAQWPVDAKDTEALFASVHRLREKIEAAKLAGNPQEGKRPVKGPEKEDALEEADGPEGSSNMDDSDSGTSGDMNVPNFVFLAKITDQERQKALGQVLERAKTNAAQVAQSAGARLGPLVACSGESPLVHFASVFRGRFAPGIHPGYEVPWFGRNGDGEANEATSSDPGPVKFTFTAHAGFALESAAESPGTGR